MNELPITDDAAKTVSVIKRHFVAQELVDKASRLFSISPEIIYGPSRDREYCQARWAVWLVLREAGYSYPRIGRIFGKDHATIMNGTRRCEQFIQADDLYAALVECLRSEG